MGRMESLKRLAVISSVSLLVVAGTWVVVHWVSRPALETVAKAPVESSPQGALGPTPACTVRLAKEPGAFSMQCSCHDLWGAILSKQGNWLLLPLYEAACGELKMASEASSNP